MVVPRQLWDGAAGSFVPRAAGLAEFIGDMVDNGCRAAVLEVSSDSLSHGSFDGIAFHAAVVTDIAAPFGFPADVVYEKRRSKARLFRKIMPGGVAVVNAADTNAEVLGGVNLDARRVAFALEPTTVTKGAIDVSGRLVRFDRSGTRMVLHGFDRETGVHLPLINPQAPVCALAAAALAWAMEIDRADVVAGLESVEPIAGYLEAIVEGQDFDIRVDVAQTPDAVAEALAALRSIAMGRVHFVLSAEGCGDRAARRWLAEVAETGADRVILTLNNPRTEDPDQILDDLLAGFRRPGKVQVLPDRRIAIETALSNARFGDVVLIGGKGRQNYQIFANSVIPFDDCAVARQWLQARRPTTTQRLA
jgi:UDP-N-acetylmuramoyl-L-alanyl-D-glutamate--2,6-diaminopimelate ligase